MRFIKKCLFFALFFNASLFAEASVEDPSGGVPKPAVDLPFPVGEVLAYDIYWGWIGVGTSVATTRWEWRDDRWYIVIQFRTQTNNAVERLYPVDDNVETWIDAATLRPLRFTTKLSAGRQTRDEETEFDWETMTATYRRRRSEDRVEVKTYTIEENTRDLVSFMYFMRNQEFEANQSYEFEVVVNDKMYELDVRTRRMDRVNLKNYGRIQSLRIDPRASFDGVFVRRGEMSVWLSQDVRRILTKLELDTPFAKVKLLLRNVRGPGDDDWIKKAEKE